MRPTFRRRGPTMKILRALIFSGVLVLGATILAGTAHGTTLTIDKGFVRVLSTITFGTEADFSGEGFSVGLTSHLAIDLGPPFNGPSSVSIPFIFAIVNGGTECLQTVSFAPPLQCGFIILTTTQASRRDRLTFQRCKTSAPPFHLRRQATWMSVTDLTSSGRVPSWGHGAPSAAPCVVSSLPSLRTRSLCRSPRRFSCSELRSVLFASFSAFAEDETRFSRVARLRHPTYRW
jgi:hypothetical protein